MPVPNSALLKALRQKTRFTQEDIAEQCQCSAKVISNAERGKIVSVETLQALASIYEIDNYNSLILPSDDNDINRDELFFLDAPPKPVGYRASKFSLVLCDHKDGFSYAHKWVPIVLCFSHFVFCIYLFIAGLTFVAKTINPEFPLLWVFPIFICAVGLFIIGVISTLANISPKLKDWEKNREVAALMLLLSKNQYKASLIAYLNQALSHPLVRSSSNNPAVHESAQRFLVDVVYQLSHKNPQTVANAFRMCFGNRSPNLNQYIDDINRETAYHQHLRKGTE